MPELEPDNKLVEGLHNNTLVDDPCIVVDRPQAEGPEVQLRQVGCKHRLPLAAYQLPDSLQY